MNKTNKRFFCSALLNIIGLFCLSCIWLTLLLSSTKAQKDTEKILDRLPPSTSIERNLFGGESHYYEIKLKSGEYFHVDVEQRGIDVVLILIAQDGKIILERDRPNDVQGAEALSFLTTTSGSYTLEVKSEKEDVHAGKYEIKREALKTPTQVSKKRIQAEALFQEGSALADTDNEESVKQASEKYEAAIVLWREVGDEYAEALTQTSLGYVEEVLSQPNKAAAAHKKALVFYKKINDKPKVAESLSALCILDASFQRDELSIEEFKEAKMLYQELNDLNSQSDLNTKFLGAAEYYLKAGYNFFLKQNVEDYKTGVRFLLPAQEMFHELGETKKEASVFVYLGSTNNALGDKQKALNYFQQALILYRVLKDQPGEGTTLNHIGLIYNNLGDNEKALEYYFLALPIRRAIPDQAGEAITLGNIGSAYSDLQEKEKALEYLNQALILKKALKDKAGEAITLVNIGVVYSSLDEKQRALDYYDQASNIKIAPEDKALQGSLLNNYGSVYYSLGEYQKALDYFNRTLPYLDATGDQWGKARLLNNLGRVYNSTNEKDKALDYFNQALTLEIAIKDRRGEATALNNIGSVYQDLGNVPKSLEYYNRSLSAYKEIKDKSGESGALNNIGLAYDDLNDKKKALEYYYQALHLNKMVGDKTGEATVYNNMMLNLKNLRLATLYGKQSVNLYQQIRASNNRIDSETRKAFLKSVEYTYQNLANILIEQGRLVEAHQVLNAFKDQQFFDFNSQTTKRPLPIAMTRREEELSYNYNLTSENIGKIINQIDENQRLMGDRVPNSEESEKKGKLDLGLLNANNEFLSVVKRAETEFNEQADAIKDKAPDIEDTRVMQETLDKLSDITKNTAVTIYFSAGETNSWVLIITAKDIIPINIAISGSELNQKAKSFRTRISKVDEYTKIPVTPQEEIKKSGKELYDVIFAPIAAKLKKYDIKPDVLMWSLDSGLRYIPVTALYNGKQYLGEQYKNVIFTRADPARFLAPVSREWTGTGFYNSKESLVRVNRELRPFPELKNAKAELEAIFGISPQNGIVKGKFIPDASFTKDSFLENVKQNSQLIHISSHFWLQPGDSRSSFLLLGDGQQLTLSDIKEMPDDLFAGTELLTLSACETGVQEERASDGREIDSFAELTQRKGAKAILASLWSVDDESTSQFMVQFYKTRQAGKLTKAEAFQKAQINLLKNSNFSHPYYWAPFILIGNWR